MGKGVKDLPNPNKLRMPDGGIYIVGLRVMRFVVERETAQIIG